MPSVLQFGLIGHPVNHSLSPSIHEKALSSFGFDGCYQLLDWNLESFDRNFYHLPEMGYSGVNITIPYKERTYEKLSSISEMAKFVQSVNTIRIDSSGEMQGYNTDVYGLCLAIDQYISNLNKQQAIIFGAGGAARACAAGAMLRGWKKIIIAARNVTKAKKLSDDLKTQAQCFAPLEKHSQFIELLPSSLEGALELARSTDLVVNATPIGLLETEIPEWCNAFFAQCTKELFFYDTVYKRDETHTPLTSLAMRYDINCASGFSMLLAQAMLAFQIWTGRYVASC